MPRPQRNSGISLIMGNAKFISSTIRPTNWGLKSRNGTDIGLLGTRRVSNSRF